MVVFFLHAPLRWDMPRRRRRGRLSTIKRGRLGHGGGFSGRRQRSGSGGGGGTRLDRLESQVLPRLGLVSLGVL